MPQFVPVEEYLNRLVVLECFLDKLNVNVLVLNPLVLASFLEDEAITAEELLKTFRFWNLRLRAECERQLKVLLKE